MHQNQSNQRYREWKDGDPTRPPIELGIKPESVTLHLLDGDKITFYYLYLVKAVFKLGDTFSAIILFFTSDIVTLKGYRLEALRAEFAVKKPSDVYVCNPRYIVPEAVTKPVVIEALVEERKS